MHYILIIRPDDRLDPTPEESDPGPWVERADVRGARLMGRGLHGRTDATTVRVVDGETLVADGPFAEAHEQIAGFDLLDVADEAEAIGIAAAHPVAGFGAVEVRAVWPFSALDPLDGVSALAGLVEGAEGAEGDGAAGRYYLMLMVDLCERAGVETVAEPVVDTGTGPAVEPTDSGRPDAWIEEAARRDVDRGGFRLRPADEARTVRVRDGQALVTDGPFAETREQVAGVQLVEVADLDEAIELAAMHPAADHGPIEIRPVLSEEEMAAMFGAVPDEVRSA